LRRHPWRRGARGSGRARRRGRWSDRAGSRLPRRRCLRRCRCRWPGCGPWARRRQAPGRAALAALVSGGLSPGLRPLRWGRRRRWRRGFGNRRPGQGRRPGILHRPRRRRPEGPVMRPELEGQPRPLRIADGDALAVVDVDHRCAVAVEVGPVRRTVVDRQPSALVEPQNQVRAGYPGVGDAQVGVQVTADDHLVAGREGILGPVVPNSQHRRVWSTHHTSIGLPGRWAPWDSPVIRLCFNLATHSGFTACIGLLPIPVGHDSIVRGMSGVSAAGPRRAQTQLRAPSRCKHPGCPAPSQVAGMPAGYAEKRGGEHAWTR
jgi:hypothetical protein